MIKIIKDTFNNIFYCIDNKSYSEEFPIPYYNSERGGWYKEGYLIHREGGPAIELANGTKEWYKNGQRHREEGPAVECYNGAKKWYKNNNLHREDGPAIDWNDNMEGNKEWYLDGKFYGYDNEFTNESWYKFVKTLIFS